MPGMVACTCHPAINWDRQIMNSRSAQFLFYTHMSLLACHYKLLCHGSLIFPVFMLLWFECDPYPLPQTHVFQHLVSRRWCCLGRPQNLWDTRHGWWRWVTKRKPLKFHSSALFVPHFWPRSPLPHLLIRSHCHKQSCPILSHNLAFPAMMVCVVRIPSMGR